ncbi:MAG: F0F1 ATP synthase subunit epsilon [Gammaproteobacteria bacterium]|nr:F0F1 ATP synthase subunit epsilon [Gammaproteobacteria bacterium]MCY4219731.1 F0F1 ATP synthase subunit epsilon [Gammaproteobacteria bacterium]MCY4276194.1 F0F1 ATP synthase subunit epsilon [Gammaproteobacteria bacterium]
MSTIRVEIVSAEQEIWSGEGVMVFVPGIAGELGIAPRHAPLITRLTSGDVRVQMEDGVQNFFFITGGLLEIQPDLVTVLSDTAMRGDELDEEAAHAAMKRAEEQFNNTSVGDQDYADMKAELAAWAAQIRAIEKLKKIRG